MRQTGLLKISLRYRFDKKLSIINCIVKILKVYIPIN